MLCVLCESPHLKDLIIQEKIQTRHYFCCEVCSLTFLNPSERLSSELEKERYDLHKNDVFAEGYQKFVTPLVSRVESLHSQEHLGLDYGSGPNSAVSHLLGEKGYRIKKYDPFFAADMEALRPKSYDYVVVCEVAEHFYKPQVEFQRLKELLRGPGSSLFILTQLKTDQVDFKKWYYRRDVTHVSFYSEKTFDFIKSTWGFAEIQITKPNLIQLTI